MRQKGFATIFGLCLILVVTIIVKGINDAETNHAREVINFETEQILQRAAESAIVEAANNIRNDEPVSVLPKTFKRGEQTIPITVDVWHERGAIHVDGNNKDGFYIMSRATMDDDFFGEKIYRRAYAYILDGDTTIRFMELP